ncbi:MAG TPA: 4Fe-4S dicluster domain-containing protein [Candidatus Dormibacteraeota bacterium]|nr:4Fe-4S dicluster domain-containing protein [Candidatus Dormibacteraeota bacterium]
MLRPELKPPGEEGAPDAAVPLWAKVIDQSRCIGCHACTTACKSENEVPLSVTRTYVKSVDVGVYPAVRRSFQVTRCNQCDDPPCVHACPTSAMYRRPDGIVDFDKSVCIGCKACIAACPYDAIFINPEDHSAEKCNFCAHRIDMGLEPACVVVCPVEAILVGDLRDSGSRVAQYVNREVVQVRRPEKATRPKLFYKDAHIATLDPLAARRPEGGLYMWSEQAPGTGEMGTGARTSPANSSAAAIVSYDVAHHAPWDWRVSLYTWTKGVGAGVYLAALLLGMGSGWPVVTPLLSGIFLAMTGLILIADLEHPLRFVLIFRRPQWRSWLVRGAVVISLYGAALVAQFTLGVAGQVQLTHWMALGAAPLAVLTAVYTAYLFAQARARDLWQSPLLAPHMLVQALMLGAAVEVLVGALNAPRLLALLAAVHLLLVAGEVTIGHPTAHAREALHEMTAGRFRRWFWAGVVLTLVAGAAPWLGPFSAVAALAAVLTHEHAHVQAGQSVPLA